MSEIKNVFKKRIMHFNAFFKLEYTLTKDWVWFQTLALSTFLFLELYNKIMKCKKLQSCGPRSQDGAWVAVFLLFRTHFNLPTRKLKKVINCLKKVWKIISHPSRYNGQRRLLLVPVGLYPVQMWNSAGEGLGYCLLNELIFIEWWNVI